MASTDARPVPRKGVAYRHTFGIFDSLGELVSGAAALDSEVSKDGGAFTDCTNEATEIAQGVYFLDLTAAEMDADTVAVSVKTSTSAAAVLIVLHPEEAGDYRADVTHWGGTAVASAVILAAANIASGALTASKFASGAFDAVWSVATRLLTAGTNIVLAKGVGVTGLNDIDAGAVRTELATELARIDVATSSRLAAASYAAPDNSGISAITGLAAAIKVKTDNLNFGVAGKVDSNVTHINETEVTGDGQDGSRWGPI